MLSSLLSTIFLVLSFNNAAFGDIVIALRYHPHLMPEDRFKDLPASFGPHPSSLRGLAVYADPPDACLPLARPPVNASNERWIVVIQRNNCTFEHKVRMAQNASYDAVIIHNVNSSELVPMSAKNPFGIHIPCTFVGYETGLAIKNNYQWDSDYVVIMTADDSNNINTQLLIPFAVVVGLCFTIMLIFMIVKFIKDRIREGRHRLPPSSLNKIPIHKFAKGDPYDTCAICLEDYLDGEKLRVLPCAHGYHSKCIDPWLTKNRRVCPMCKRKVFAQDETSGRSSDTDSDSSDSDNTDDTTPLFNPATRNSHGTFARQTENPFQRAARSVSQLGEGEHGYQNEGLFVTASGDHSINAEVIDTDSEVAGMVETATHIIEVPSTSVETNRDLVI